jgi:glycosyltransferase involved in cell wall biosynthesis
VRVIISAAQHAIGGGITHLRELLPRLVAVDPADRYLLVATQEVAEQIELPDNVRVLRTPQWPSGALEYLPRFVWENAALPLVARRFGADVVFFPLPSTALWGGRRAVGMFRNAIPFDRAWVESGIAAIVRGRLLGRLQILQSSRMAATVCVSQYGRGLLVDRDTKLAGRTPVVPHGVEAAPTASAGDDDKVLRELGVRQPYVLLVSHLYRYKQVLECVSGFRRWVEPHHDVDLVVAGGHVEEPYSSDVRSAAAPAGDRIRLLGAVSAGPLGALYRRATAFVFPSRCENCPNILLEAMAYGLPIACADVPPMRELAADTALYFEPRDPAGMGLAIRSLLEDPPMATRLGDAARTRAEQYTWEIAARSTHAVLDSVARGEPIRLVNGLSGAAMHDPIAR